jgi:hypothetical protein
MKTRDEGRSRRPGGGVMRVEERGSSHEAGGT